MYMAQPSFGQWVRWLKYDPELLIGFIICLLSGGDPCPKTRSRRSTSWHRRLRAAQQAALLQQKHRQQQQQQQLHVLP